ncbi:MAG: hypothetical protein C4310_03325, partial [Chloroflexota bacterium]
RARGYVTALVGLVLTALLLACGGPAYPRVRLAQEGQPAVAEAAPRKLPLRVAVAAVIFPKATLNAYKPLLDVLGRQLDRPVRLIQRSTYAEINELIRGLTAREIEVLRLIAQGYTNAEIAERLVISVKTVETHKAHIMDKLGRRSRVELVRYALEKGLLAE